MQLVIETTKGAADWLTQGLLQVAFAFAVKLVHPGTCNRRVLLSSIVVYLLTSMLHDNGVCYVSMSHCDVRVWNLHVA